MADVIASDQSIADLLKEQKTTSQHLELFSDTNDYMQDMVLEQMLSNEELKRISGEMGKEKFSKSVDKIATYFKDVDARSDEIQGVMEINAKNQAVTEQRMEEYQKSFHGILVKSLNKVPLIGSQIDKGLEKLSDAYVEGKVRSEALRTAQPIEVPPELDPTEFYDSLETSSEKQLFHIMQMDDNIAQLLSYQEAADDVGVTSIPTGRSEDSAKDDSSNAGGLLSMFSPKGALGSLAKKFPKLASVGKVLGPIAALGFSLYEFSEGLQNAGDIVGKPMEELSTLEKTGAGLSQVISGLSLGLIDAKDAYSGIAAIAETMKGVGEDIFNMMPDSVQKGLGNLSDILFDDKDGIFGFAKKTFAESIDKLSQGDIAGGFSQLLIGGLGSIFGPQGYIWSSVNKAWEAVKEGASLTLSLFPDSVQNVVNDAVEGIKEVAGSWKDGFVDTVMTLFNSVTDMLPKSVSDVLGKAANFFGFGKDKASETIEKLPEAIKADEIQNKLKKDAALGDKAAIAELGKTNKAFSAQFDENEVVANETTIQRFRPGTRIDSSIKQGGDKGVPTEFSTEAISLSKKRMEESKYVPQSAPQPIVITQNQPAPKKTILRELSIGDTELAMMNANMLDS